MPEAGHPRLLTMDAEMPARSLSGFRFFPKFFFQPLRPGSGRLGAIRIQSNVGQSLTRLRTPSRLLRLAMPIEQHPIHCSQRAKILWTLRRCLVHSYLLCWLSTDYCQVETDDLPKISQGMERELDVEIVAAYHFLVKKIV